MPQKKKQPPKSDPLSKRLTWWHPLFGSALDFSGKNAFQVLREVEVGQLPMLIDIIILLRDENLPLPDWTLNAAPSLFGRLNKCTIVEFKGPSDRIEDGDFALSLSRALAWVAKHDQKLKAKEITLLFVVPTLTKPMRDEVKRLGSTVRKDSDGVFEITGSVFETWVIESVAGAKRGEPLLSLVSPSVLEQPHDLLDKLSAGPYGELVGFCFRQIQQFQRNAKDFQLRYQDYEQMNALSKELEEEILDLIPAERRLKGIPTEQRLEGIPTEERLEGIPTEQRLEGIPLEGRLEGLSETEKKELLARLLADSEQDSAKN